MRRRLAKRALSVSDEAPAGGDQAIQAVFERGGPLGERARGQRRFFSLQSQGFLQESDCLASKVQRSSGFRLVHLLQVFEQMAEAQDPAMAVLLLDFILGYNASMEPVAELMEAIQEAKQTVVRRGGKLTTVASICGTDGDPQILDLQIKQLKDAGVFVFQSNAKATSFCCELLKQE